MKLRVVGKWIISFNHRLQLSIIWTQPTSNRSIICTIRFGHGVIRVRRHICTSCWFTKANLIYVRIQVHWFVSISTTRVKQSIFDLQCNIVLLGVDWFMVQGAQFGLYVWWMEGFWVFVMIIVRSFNCFFTCGQFPLA